MMSTSTKQIIRVKAPLKSEVRIIRLLIICGLIFMTMFLYWFISPGHVGYAPVFWLLTFGLVFKLAKMLHEWYHYWNLSVPEMPTKYKRRTVDILTTACPGEPKDMIIRTLYAMKAITYPHTNYLCDEGNDPELKKVCDELGVIHVTRTIKKDAKAGNINNALQQATGELCVILDPDHVPIPEFLDRVVPYFEQNDIGYVQCVQAYGNQRESFIARGAAEQTYHFYGPMMMCMNSYGTVQAIGANCTFRRAALDSIGGHAPGLAEDMHTAMQLHAKGWKSIYVPEILSRGLVPATLSAYYKQQLKWSRGTFELLFRTYPSLFKNFTWRQKLHYFCIPIYFLFGLINLLDIAIPVLALGLAQVPWEVDMVKFGMFFLPMCLFSMMIRLYSQRWLLEKHERGFHFAGGILRTATWWVFLIGFIYSIFKIKVPYIPTPKEDEHQNYFTLSLPNFIVMLISVGFMIYGLYIDWTPYSLAMAFYSFITAGMLAFTVLMSQQKFLLQAENFFSKFSWLSSLKSSVWNFSGNLQQMGYSLIRNSVVVILISLSLILISSVSIISDEKKDQNVIVKEFGSFYFGTEGSDTLTGQLDMNLVSLSKKWGETPASGLIDEVNELTKKGNVPYISLQTSGLDEQARSILYKDIYSGKYDGYLKGYASFLRNHKEPVFMTFESIQNASAAEFVKSWQYIYTFFNDLGISNVTWVWRPSSKNELASYPGEKFVDWIGIPCLNYAADKTKPDWYSFNELYDPYRKNYGQLQKPVMITGFGSVSGFEQLSWFNNALKAIRTDYKEIHSVIVYTSKNEIGTSNGSQLVFDFSLRPETFSSIQLQLKDEDFKAYDFVKRTNDLPDYKSSFVKGDPGNFKLFVNNKPYYIKGVAYNTAHDWRDGHMPLTRRQLEKDFENIKAMGANTIRRYGHGIYDRNVLNLAKEHDLNVLYGFWFDPKVDFFKDTAKVLEYMNEVEEKVLKYKDHPAVIAWSLGNESWGLLKHSFAKPYLTSVRNAYVKMIEHLAERIHQLDPTRPVFSCIEHEEYQLPGELVAFHDGAPSIDVMGINSYYKEQISKLNHVAWHFDSVRPYIVSEFGPSGYWDPKYNKVQNNSLVEESDEEKAQWYKAQWNNYVSKYDGYNVGGFAYCWHDRMEGSFTWFGLTDYKGRLKPSYFALKEEWTDKEQIDMPEYKIALPSELIPGNTYTVSAFNLGKIKNDMNYEWRLLKDENFEEVNAVEIKEDASEITLTIPEEKDNYRLYLFVTDKEDKTVTTSSVPIKVIKSKLN